MELEFYAYETYCMVRIEDRPDAWEILRECRNIALKVEKTLNMYDPLSELSIMNRKYQPGQPYHVTGLLFDFMEICVKMAQVCEGAFDPTVGGLVKEWKIGSGREEVLSSEKICKLLEKTGYRHIKLIPKEKKVLMDAPGIIFDPGAAGKGYAIDLVVNYLREKNVKKGCLDFGGNLYVLEPMGDRKDPQSERIEDANYWRIGIRHPEDSEKVMACVNVKNEAVSTSSWYEHYFVKDGKTYCHLLNPSTGKPADSGLLSVTIVTPRGIYADILSTAFYVLGEEKGRKILDVLKKDGIVCRGVLMRADRQIVVL